MVEAGKEAGGIDAHQPIRLGHAQGGVEQAVIVRAGPQGLEARPDGGVLHAGNPQPGEGLLTPRLLVDQPKDELSFPPGVGGADQTLHVLPRHERRQRVELPAFLRGEGIFPLAGQNGQPGQLPLGVGRVVGVGGGQPRQMPQAPGDEVAPALQVAVPAALDAQHSGDGLRHAGLFRDDKLHIVNLLL